MKQLQMMRDFHEYRSNDTLFDKIISLQEYERINRPIFEQGQNLRILILHDADADGYCAAALTKLAFNGEDVECRALMHGKEFDNAVPEIFEKENYEVIVVLDHAIQSIHGSMIAASSCKQVIWIDHHRADEVEDLGSRWIKVIDPRGSTALLTAMFFNAPKMVDEVVELIDFNDRWLYSTEPGPLASRALYFNKWLMAQGLENIAWKDLLSGLAPLSDYIKAGEAYHFALQSSVEYAVKNHTRITSYPANDAVENIWKVGVILDSGRQSEIGAEILRQYGGEIDFAAVIMFRGNNVKFSFRSTDTHLDVQKIAQELGGYGHRNAAGVELPLNFSKLDPRLVRLITG